MINIGIYGRTNAGKSTLVNFLCGASVSIVSDQKGTTTDPVVRRWEIPGFDTITLIDTAGLDDNTTTLGKQRVAKTMQTIERIDLAVIVVEKQIGANEEELITQLGKIPHVIVNRKNYPRTPEELIEIIRLKVKTDTTPSFYGDKLSAKGTVILVCPIDKGAPNGRMILPQMQALRAALELHCNAIVVQPEELANVLAKNSPNLIVTDASAIANVRKTVGTSNIPITSFSALLAEQKGDATTYQKALFTLQSIKQGDNILVIEHCSHHASCGDIGREKIPQLLNKFTKHQLNYTFITNRDALPENLKQYKLAVQCGGCMTTRGHIMNIIDKLNSLSIPVTNYGMLLEKIS